MKLDTTHLRYLTPEDWRVLTAVRPPAGPSYQLFNYSLFPNLTPARTQVETGSKNHEIVPTTLIIQISNLRSGSGAHRSISTLAKANLIARVQHAKYDGYRLTYGGLDYLALHTHLQRKTLRATGPMIGTGKESDIHIVLAPPPVPSSSSSSSSITTTTQPQTSELILKIHRLGRISFRSIKTNRDYLRHRSSATWLHMSRLSALKEYTFMRALHTAGFPVPTPVACSRHTVVMSLVQGTPLYQVQHLQPQQARGLYAELIALIVRLAGVGLIHGDFNEFNIMIEEHENSEEEAYLPPITAEQEEEEEEEEEEEKDDDPEPAAAAGRITLRPILIDFPQMLSISHPNASTYFDRDVGCVKRYFARRYHFTSDDPGPFFADVERRQSMMMMKKKKQKKKKKKNEEGVEGGVGDDRRLDVEVEASGFSRKMAKELEKYMEEVGADGDGDGDDGHDSVKGDDSDDSYDISVDGDNREGNPTLSLADEVPDAASIDSGNVPPITHEIIPPRSDPLLS
ncbi:MAG: hypothetical protein Q9210_001433 [Variospora velana]